MFYCTRKSYSIVASEGKFYIGGFVFDGLNEFQQYQTAYVELTFARLNAVEFSRIFF